VVSWEAVLRPLRARARRRARRAGDPFGHVDFVIVDLETTGWSPQEAWITEIGAVRISGGQVCAQFSSLVRTPGAIPAPVTALTGISDAMVAAAPRLAQVLPVFLAFADGCVLAAHNAAFDVSFLEAACQACGLRWPGFPVLDTVGLAHRALADGEVPDCKLATLADFFGAKTAPRHRALPDALATADVLTGLLARLTAAGIRTLTDICVAGTASV
jgi:DNA polymerase-3 subunit epsilon